MAISTANKPNWLIALGIPFLIYLSCFLITAFSRYMAGNNQLSNGIIGDLLITAPLIYFLAIRKSKVPKWTVLSVIVAGLLMARFIIPVHSNPNLQIIEKWILPFFEAIIIFIICKKFYTANKNAKADSNQIDFLMHCRSVMNQVLGNEKLANIVSSEIAVIYYAFFAIRVTSIDYKTKFTSNKENGLPAVLGAILSILLIETIGVHFLLSLWSTTIAWILTALSFYTCIQLFAHMRALNARPIIIHSNCFEVRNGLAGDALIQYHNIEKIELSNKKPIGRASFKISLFKEVESHNIVVYLKNSIEVTKIFGIKKRTDTVLFFVDKPKEFITIVTTLLTNHGS